MEKDRWKKQMEKQGINKKDISKASKKAHGKYKPWLAVFLLLTAIYLLYTGIHLYREKQAMARKTAENQETLLSASGNQPGIIELDGKRYRRNTAVRAILCIGVDTAGDMELHQASGQAGQADGLFLVAQDMARDTVKVMMIPRDTMTEITLFDLMGNELGKDVQHLTLSFAYGDGREGSCELMKEAVSNLLYGLKIDGYMAMNTSAISVLNDEAGGVTVAIETDALEARDPAMKKGETILLNGKQAETFVRYRDTNQAQTAISRMDRQKQYMQAYLETVKTNAKTDDSLITRLMKQIETQAVTNMSKDQYMDMGLAVLNSGQSLLDSDFYTVPGEAVETQLFDEYHPDKEALKRMVVELFYKEAG